MTNFPSKKELSEVRKKLNKGIASYALPKNASPVEKVKYDICRQFVLYKKEHDVSQKELADLTGIDQSLMSKILHYQINEFTTDRLIKYLENIFDEVEIRIKVA